MESGTPAAGGTHPTQHPAVTDILRHFSFLHLPEELQAVSKPIHDLAHEMADRLGAAAGAELTVGLRKLLEAKDCLVRAAIVAKPSA